MNECKRSLWVWTPKQLSDTQEKKELLELCQKEKITHLYFQVIFSARTYPKFKIDVEGKEYYRDLIREANNAGIKVFALSSKPKAASKQEHPRLLSEIKSLIEYNKESREEERFAGVHYSFDFHMLEGFSGKNLRSYLVHIIQLCKKVHKHLAAARPRLPLSVDMPFWFLTGMKGPLPRFVFDLRFKEAGEHLIDNVEEVVVFPYRNTLEGDDGIEALVRPSIEYANKARKKVLIGLETIPVSSKRASFAQLGKKGLKDVAEQIAKTFQGSSGLGGIGINDYTNYREMN